MEEGEKIMRIQTVELVGEGERKAEPEASRTSWKRALFAAVALERGGAGCARKEESVD